MKPIITTLLLLFPLTAFTQTSIDTSEIFTVVEDMPVFPGCEDLKTNVERKKCTETNLLKFCYKNINTNSLPDTCLFDLFIVISFVIDTRGYITEIKKLKGCEDLAKEIIRVIESMNKMPQRWKPGEHRGQKVSVKYNLPLRFHFNRH